VVGWTAGFVAYKTNFVPLGDLILQKLLPDQLSLALVSNLLHKLAAVNVLFPEYLLS
jgi:hypothetical protein